MLSHRNLLLNVFYGGQCQALTEHDRICIPVPFYHCFGCVLGTMMAVVHGAAMVVPAESFDPAATLDAIEKERCTSLYGVPTMFIAQLNDPSLPGRESEIAAHRHHGGQSLPDRNHAGGGRTHWVPRNHHRLRPDRSLAHHHANPFRRSDRECAWKRLAGRSPAWK